jgi:uncharacterized protein YuzE
VYFYLKAHKDPGEVTEGAVLDIAVEDCAFIVELNADKRVIGIEVLGARRLLPREVLEGAERSKRE